MLNKRILLIIGGGIAAYKSLEVIRRLLEKDVVVTPVLTAAGEEFITALTVSGLAGQRVYRELFDYDNEIEMGHIQLSRNADLLVVAPATADLMAKAAAGFAGDLATTLLLATDKPVIMAPAMNVRMWEHPTTRRNVATLIQDGIRLVGPQEGVMACGEFGMGRMAEPTEILSSIENYFAEKTLKGIHVIVTSGPTHEPIDPVRYIGNRSSGVQGTALAHELAILGAKVTFITGPTSIAPPDNVAVKKVGTAKEMAQAVEKSLPADVAVFAAAVADWRAESISDIKIKKNGNRIPSFKLVENDDILAGISQRQNGRPKLVIGFAAETNDVEENARRKLERKGCDWIVANNVSSEAGIMGGLENEVSLISLNKIESWPRMEKKVVAQKLAKRIVTALNV
ncbi:MAG: bifunctional phosphopantothenoylcysteine decarboxylase/phosphopantothenate--cysteine ligase CoaBC [Aestuariivita sp.]|nr:bifunctional phosphopantothenoylcysteine decarboxylase/phosphopantothenate--cysteine ligase CoaBC [Aestuariivita sp.]